MSAARRTAVVVLVALALGACRPGDPSGADAVATGTERPDPASSPTTLAPTASPTPTQSPAVPGIVVWGRGGLSPAIATAASALPGVLSASVVPSDTLGLTGSRRADGTPVDDLEAGWRIPVNVAAIDPASYAATVDSADAPRIAGLEPGQVLLTESSAARRRLVPGDRLDLEGATDLVVAHVLGDDTLARVEIVVHRDDAAAVGLDEDGTLFVETDVADPAGRETLATQLEALVPGDVVARVVDLVDTGRERRRAPLVLSLAQVKERFGEFAFRPAAGRAIEIDPAWVDEHIVDADVPILGTVRCHREIIAPLRQALQTLADAGRADLVDLDRYAGCFNARRISEDRARLSRHAWGIAVDLNVDLGVPGGGEVPDPAIVTAFAEAGFVWGGEFIVPDNHHYEFVGPGWPLTTDDR